MQPLVLDQVVATPDILTTNHFNLMVAAIPGGGNSYDFTVRNMTAVLPSKKNEPLRAVLHRHTFLQAGKTQYNHSFNASFLEARDGSIINTFRNWQGMINEPGTNLPVPKDQYITTGLVEIYGADNSIVDRRQFFGLWVANIGEVQLNGSSDELMKYDVTFAYDFWDYV
jgi:hypothetical protein